MVEMILNKQCSLGNKKCHADLKRENLILSFIEKFSTIYSIRNGSTVFLRTHVLTLQFLLLFNKQ